MSCCVKNNETGLLLKLLKIYFLFTFWEIVKISSTILSCFRRHNALNWLWYVPIEKHIHNDHVTKKWGFQKSYSPYTIFYGPCLSCYGNLLHIYRDLPSLNPDCPFVLSRWSGSIRTMTDSATQHSTQQTALVMPSTQMHQRKYSDLIHRSHT